MFRQVIFLSNISVLWPIQRINIRLQFEFQVCFTSFTGIHKYQFKVSEIRSATRCSIIFGIIFSNLLHIFSNCLSFFESFWWLLVKIRWSYDRPYWRGGSGWARSLGTFCGVGTYVHHGTTISVWTLLLVAKFVIISTESASTKCARIGLFTLK